MKKESVGKVPRDRCVAEVHWLANWLTGWLGGGGTCHWRQALGGRLTPAVLFQQHTGDTLSPTFHLQIGPIGSNCLILPTKQVSRGCSLCFRRPSSPPSQQTTRYVASVWFVVIVTEHFRVINVASFIDCWDQLKAVSYTHLTLPTSIVV